MWSHVRLAVLFSIVWNPNAAYRLSSPLEIRLTVWQVDRIMRCKLWKEIVVAAVVGFCTVSSFRRERQNVSAVPNGKICFEQVAQLIKIAG